MNIDGNGKFLMKRLLDDTNFFQNVGRLDIELTSSFRHSNRSPKTFFIFQNFTSNKHRYLRARRKSSFISLIEWKEKK